jgi:hypothetical protein
MSETGELARTTAQPENRPAIAWRPVLVVAAVAAAVHLAIAARYGWHRDEFYYVITGRHLDWGYVDQPPLTPVLARLAAALPGGVLPLRILAIACQVGCVLLGAKLAAEFGGRAKAQTIAAGAVAACPIFVAGASIFGTTITDQLVWAAMFVAVARALRLRTTGSWLLVGLAGGVGMENKDTTVVLLLGITIGLVVWYRDLLRTPGPWLAGGITIVLAIPNLLWDARHDWPNLAMAHVLAQRTGGTLGSLAQVPLLAIVLAGPPLVILWIGGVRWLGWGAGRDHRWMLAVAATALVVFTAAGGKSYYPAPVLLGLFAAGAVRAETVNRVKLRWPIAIAVSALVAILIGYPVLPAGTESTLHAQTMLETYGWPDFVDQVSSAAATLPAGTPIFTSNYGEAGALTILGPSRGLHNPVFSGQNSYRDWGPPAGSPDTVLCVGEFPAAALREAWSDVRPVAAITMPDGVHNQEINQHAAIYVCRQPHGTWAQLWPHLRHYS